MRASPMAASPRLLTMPCSQIMSSSPSCWFACVVVVVRVCVSAECMCMGVWGVCVSVSLCVSLCLSLFLSLSVSVSLSLFVNTCAPYIHLTQLPFL